MRRSEMVELLVVTLAGRVAEELVFDDPTSGAHDDLRRATTIARKMVCEFGTSDKISDLWSPGTQSTSLSWVVP